MYEPITDRKVGRSTKHSSKIKDIFLHLTNAFVQWIQPKTPEKTEFTSQPCEVIHENFIRAHSFCKPSFDFLEKIFHLFYLVPSCFTEPIFFFTHKRKESSN